MEESAPLLLKLFFWNGIYATHKPKAAGMPPRGRGAGRHLFIIYLKF